MEFRLYTHWNLKQLNRTMPEKPSKGYMMENNFSCQNGTVVLFYNWEENPFEMREFETFSKDMGMLFFKSVIVANYFKTVGFVFYWTILLSMSFYFNLKFLFDKQQ